MTTEDDFQRALDADPDDWQTRLVFADRLQERNDPRAAGYRALGELRKWPVGPSTLWHDWYWYRLGSSVTAVADHALPNEWFDEMTHGPGPRGPITIFGSRTSWPKPGVHVNRAAAENAAALAFARLPPTNQEHHDGQ
jgi:uncharacterized protein (TIGR02996 family)